MGRRRSSLGARPGRRASVLVLALAVAAGVAAVAVSAAATKPPAGAAAYRPPTDLPSVTPVRSKPMAVFIGDSYTSGSNAGGVGDKNYSALVAQHEGWFLTNLGVGGSGYLSGAPQYSFGSPARMQGVQLADPDIVFVVNAVDDLQLANPLSKLTVAADKTYAAIRLAAPHAKIIVIGLIAPGPAASFPAMRVYQNALRAAADEAKLPFWDPLEEDWFGGAHKADIGSDQFHPSDAGNAYMATLIESHIQLAGLSGARAAAG